MAIRKIKIISIIIIILLLPMAGFAQVIKFRTTMAFYRIKNQTTNNWNEWSNPSYTDILITYNSEKSE